MADDVREIEQEDGSTRLSFARQKMIKIRVSNDELTQLRDRVPGNQALAVWMREYCLSTNEYVAPELPTNHREPPKVDESLIRQLRAIGINLNQLAKVANSNGCINAEVLSSLLRIERALGNIESAHRAS